MFLRLLGELGRKWKQVEIARRQVRQGICFSALTLKLLAAYGRQAKFELEKDSVGVKLQMSELLKGVAILLHKLEFAILSLMGCEQYNRIDTLLCSKASSRNKTISGQLWDNFFLPWE